MEIDAVNQSSGIALTSDGKIIPITDYLDEVGDPCDPDEAVSVIAGPDGEGKWWHIVLSDYTQCPH